MGMVLQQSWVWWPCEKHGIVLQHCIAEIGDVAAPQSIAYAESAAAMIATQIDLANRTI